MSKSLNLLPIINTTSFRSGNGSPRIYTPEIVDCTFHHVEDWTYEKVFNTLWGLYHIDPSAQVSFRDGTGKKIPMDHNFVYLIPSNTPFSTEMHRSGSMFSLNFTMHGILGSLERRIHALPAAFLEQHLPQLLHSTDPDEMLLLIQNIACYYLAQIREDHSPQEGRPGMDERVALALRYIEDHLSESFTIRRICGELRISQMTLQRLFLRDIHKTPKQFHSDLRQQQAIHLLRHTKKSLDEIALELGYTNRSQFSGAFRKNRNLPPGEYRRSFRSSGTGDTKTMPEKQKTSPPSPAEKHSSLPDLEWKQFKTGKNMLPILPCQYQCLDQELHSRVRQTEESSLWQILCAAGRKVRICAGGKIHSLPQSRCCLIPSSVRYTLMGEGVCRIFTAGFSVCEDLGSLERKIYTFPAKILRRTLEDLTDEKEEIRRQLLLQSMIFQYLSKLERSHFISDFKNLDPRIMHSVQRISSSLRSRVHISDLAREVNMSLNSFRMLFKTETGLTPRGFIHVQRMKEVEKLLTGSDLTLAEIALRCGFADAFTLSKYFSKHKNISPMQYRRKSCRNPLSPHKEI